MTNPFSSWSPRRRKITLLVSAITVVAIAATSLAIVFAQRPSEPEPAAIRPPSPTVSTPPDRCLTATDLEGGRATLAPASRSDEIDSWAFGYLHGGPTVVAAASSTRHGGLAALELSAGGNVPIPNHYRQDLRLVEGSEYKVTFWARTADATQAAVLVELGPLNNERGIALSSAGSDWTFYEFAYTIPAGYPDVHLQVDVSELAGAVQIDDISITDPAGNEMVSNGGFESHSASLSLSNASLLIAENAGPPLHLTTRYQEPGSIAWCVTDAAGTPIRAAEELGAEELDVEVADLPTGFYTLTASALVDEVEVTRQTRFAVVLEAEPSTRFGIAGHLAGALDRMVGTPELISSMGLGGMRAELPWDRIEQSPGVYEYPSYVSEVMDAYAEAGVGVAMVPAYYNPNYDDGRTPSSTAGLQGYANFASSLARTFPAAGNSVEVYNEFDHFFNTGACGGSPECYMPMLEGTRTSVKSVDPEMPVVGPAIAGMGVRTEWLDPFISLGGLGYVDALTFHPYTQPAPPETLITPLRALTERLQGERPVWLTEMGWSSATDWVTDEQQVEYLSRMMALAPALGVERTYLFTLADMTDDPTSRELRFGMFDSPSSFTPRTYPPAEGAVAVATAAAFLGDAEPLDVSEGSDGLLTASYRTVDGFDLTVYWTTASNGTTSIPVADGSMVAAYDFLGRSLDLAQPLPLTTAPTFVLSETE